MPLSTLDAAPQLDQSLGLVFRHIPAQRVLLCIACQYCVVPSQAKTHLHTRHRPVPLRTRRSLVQQVLQLPDLAHSPEEVAWPAQSEGAVAGIPVQEGCLQCNVCNWLGATLAGMQEHCREKHLWHSSKGRGGTSQKRHAHNSNQMWTTGHSCQQLFRAPGWKRLTKIHVVPDLNPTLAMSGRRMLQGMDQERQQRKEQRTVTALSIQSQANPWLGHTNWDQHLLGFERRQLRDSLTVDPDASPGLARACKATRQLIHQAMRVCQTTVVPRSALVYVNRVETGASSNHRPFYSKHRQDTLRKYAAVWTKMLCYLWHSQDWEDKPPYILTSRQAGALADLKSAASLEQPPGAKTKKKQRQDLLTGLLNFWMSMLDHTLPNSEFDSGLVIAVAVLGLDTESTGWVDARNFTSKLSAIITISRALVVYSAWRIHGEEVSMHQEEGWSLEEAQDKARSVFNLVRQLVDRCMCLTQYNGKPTPIDRLLHMRTYGRSIAFNTKTVARVSWRADYSEVCIDQVHFSMTELRHAVHGLSETCKSRLVEELMYLDREENLPPLDLAGLFDNPGELVEGWSFFDDPRNAGQLPGEERKGWLWDRMLGEGHIRDRFIHQTQPGEALSLKSHAVEEYFRSIKQFKEELIVLCHLAAGAPARGPELTSIMHQNGDDSRAQRGVFVSNGLVELIIPYHKGFSFTQKLKVIHRYLPREVGEVLVYYLWLVEPFVQYLQQATRRQLDFSTHIWEPEPEQEDTIEANSEWEDSSEDESHQDFTRTLKKGSQQLTSRSGSSSDWEQSSEKESEEDNSIAAGPQRLKLPKSNQRDSLNVDGYWSTNRLKRVMKREIFLRIGVEFSPAQWRQVYPAIQRMHLSTPEMDAFIDQLYSSKATTSQMTQSGHTQWTEDNIYGILATENPLATFSVQRQFRQLSYAWHQFLHFPSAIGSDPKAAADLQKTQEQREANRWAKLKQVDLTARLQRMTKPQAQFRGVQHQALQAILARQSRVVVVMQTGGGKSLLYMLPASCSADSITAVVVPLNSLLSDQARRCKQAGLRVACWGEHKAVRLAQVVLVTPESAATKAFGRFLLEKRSAGLLDRVVIDECHILLDSIHGWRPKVLHLSQLVEKGCQLVYLTATLPPEEEPAFFASAGMSAQSALLFREATTRKNIRYRVQECPEAELDHVIQEEVQNFGAQPGQVIIYCRSIVQGQQVAELLQCPVFHRNVGSGNEKQILLDRLVQGQIRVIVATNALGLGIDAPQIRAVIHLGVPDRLRDYVQESGRAGRDGEPSTALAIRTFTRGPNGKIWLKERNLQSSMADFLKNHQCRRIALDRVMDGRSDRESCEGEELACDVCTQAKEDASLPGLKMAQDLTDSRTSDAEQQGHKRKRVASQPENVLDSAALEEHQAVQTQGDLEKITRRAEVSAAAFDISVLRDKLQHWNSQRCLICWAHGGEQRVQGGDWKGCYQHPISATEQMGKILARLKAVQMQKYSGCSYCLAPQAVCYTWREKGQASGTRTASFERAPGQRCQYPWLVREVAAAIISQRLGNHFDSVEWQWVKEQMQGQAGFWSSQRSQEDDWDRLWRWLGMKKVSNSVELSAMVWMLYYLG